MSNNENRKYKDSIFRKLFGTKEEIIPLYNQISGNHLDENTEVEIITLSDTMFLKQVNDLGFRIEDRLIVLVEQQSTLNENMALRMLLYVAREYEKILDNKILYREKMIKIPEPEFYILYNGKKRLSTVRSKLLLSDMYIHKSQNAALDLQATIIDINSDEFVQTLENTPLYQYIVAVKELQKCFDSHGDLRDCISKLIQSGMLRSFLTNNSSEVVNMLTFDFDKETYGQVKKEEGIEQGIEQGKAESIRACYKNKIPISELSKIFSMPESKIKEIISK